MADHGHVRLLRLGVVVLFLLAAYLLGNNAISHISFFQKFGLKLTLALWIVVPIIISYIYRGLIVSFVVFKDVEMPIDSVSKLVEVENIKLVQPPHRGKCLNGICIIVHENTSIIDQNGIFRNL